MNYNDFQKIIGFLDIPSENERVYELLKAKNGIHFVIKLGNILGEEYTINVSEDNMKLFLDVIEIVESRDAVRGKDFALLSYIEYGLIKLVLSTTSDFLSNEDFAKKIPRK